MRWPIQAQLLLPVLSVVVLTIAVASMASGYIGALRARQAEEESLRRVVTTLVAEDRFPLNEWVLQKMSGLSGGEFVFLDTEGHVVAATLGLTDADAKRLPAIPRSNTAGSTSSNLADQPTLELAGKTYLCQRVPIATRGPGAVSGSLAVLYWQQRWSAIMREAAYPALLAGAIAVVAVVVVTTLLAQRFVRPIRRLGDQTAGIAEGNFSPIAVSARNDEIRDLALSINRMAERLGQYQRDIRRNEQLRTLGQLGAGMAHQLRNAATGSRMAIELHQRHCSVEQSADPADRESLEVALRQLRLMESYLQRFLTLGRPHAARRDPVPLVPLVDDVVALVQPGCLHSSVTIAVEKPADSLTVCGDADELRQSIMNLVLNAIDAVSGQMAGDRQVNIVLERSSAARAILKIADNGPGPSAEVAARLFEPFVTGKPEGTGLGLFVARQIAEDHHGTLTWQRLDGWTEFRLELPVV